jgi:sugar phosphate isomerase/epimerase
MKPTYILGDNHGDYEAVFSALKERGIRDATVIHVGDGAEDPRKSLGPRLFRRKGDAA